MRRLLSICLVLACLVNPLAHSAPALQENQTPDQRRARLKEHVEYIERRIKETDDQIAGYRLEGFEEPWTLYQQIHMGYAPHPYEYLFRIISTLYESRLKEGTESSTAGFGPAANAGKEFDEANQNAGFYWHPLLHLNHHLNWVSSPEYPRKVDWYGLEKAVATWKRYDQEIKTLFEKYQSLLTEKRNSTNWTEADQARETALREKIIELSKYRGQFGLSIEAPDGPVIVRTIVITDQTAFLDGGRAKHTYPFQPGAPLNALGQQGDTRTLFVYGRGLPQDFKAKIAFLTEDPGVEYSPITVAGQQNLNDTERRLLNEGWQQALQGLDAGTAAIAKNLDAMLVRVDLRSGVLPGLKQFSLNGLDGYWRLRFGDDRAQLSVAREISSDSVDRIKAIYLPEEIFLEVRTEVLFPLKEIALKVELNGRAVTWNEKPVIIASHYEDEELDDYVEVTTSGGELPNRLVKRKARVYRTPFIQLVEEGKPIPPREYRTPATGQPGASRPAPGVFFLNAKPKDVLRARLDDPYLLGATPPLAQATVLRTIARDVADKEVMTWKEALTKSARLKGVEITDWRQLSGKEASKISNLIFTNLVLGGKVNQTVRVTVGEHAALLILRDAFLRTLEDAAKNLPNIKGEVALRGFREALKPYAWDEKSPWRYLRVTCPQGPALYGADCPYSYALSDSYLEKTFGDNKKAADAWALRATEEALVLYKGAVNFALTKAKPETTPDGDVKELVQLVGYTYRPLLPEVLPRMMRLNQVGRQSGLYWVPDLNARHSIANVATVAEALQAQQDLSKLDTQMSLLAVSLVTAPFMLGESVVCAVIGFIGEGINLSAGVADVPEFIRQRDDIKFALGASLILGTERLREAEARKTEWFELWINIAPAIAGTIFSASSVVATVRTSLLLTKLEQGGLPALSKLSEADRASFWRFAAGAKSLEEIGAVKAMSKMQRRAAALSDQLMAEIAAASEKTSLIVKRPTPKVTVKVQGDPTPPKKTTETISDQPNPNSATATLAGNLPEIKVHNPKLEGSPKPGSVVSFMDPKTGTVTKFKLGERRGAGAYNWNYKLLERDGVPVKDDLVIKIAGREEDEFFTGRAAVNNTRRGSEAAANAKEKIPQWEILEYAPDAVDPATRKRAPYVIQKEFKTIPGRMEMVGPAKFSSDTDLQEAFAELIWKIRESELGWEDPGLGNVYFFRANEKEKWAAGILDLDRIIPWANRGDGSDMDTWFSLIEVYVGRRTMRSQHETWNSPANAELYKKLNDMRTTEEFKQFFMDNPGPFFRDPEFFAERMFEHKGYIIYNPKTKKMDKVLIDPEILKKKGFKNLDSPDRRRPEDLTIPYWKLKQGLLVTPPWLNADRNLNAAGFRLMLFEGFRKPLYSPLALCLN